MRVRGLNSINFLVAAVAGCLLVGQLAGCSTSEIASEWNLVGAYDASAVVGLTIDPEAEEVPEFVWTAAPGMSKSCGPAKAPDGMGVFEAEAFANLLAPTLAIVLERTDSERDRPLTPEGVRVALGGDEPEYLMQPALEPRYISVRLEGERNIRYQQLVRTQLQMELCMEHKVGRGWIGGESKALRQAFLLDPPDGAGPDRKYFGGQRDPVPALLGPPDACLHESEELGGEIPQGGQGEGSLDLVPSDVWGASLRWCDIVETGGSALSRVHRSVPLALGELGEPIAPPAAPTWTDLRIVLGPGEVDDDIKIDLTYGDKVLLDDHPLFSRPEGLREDGRPKEAGILDLLARVPYQYPSLGTREAANRFVVLLLPNWQIVEGLRRLYAEEPDRPRPTGGRGIQDGVGWVLEHPELLFVQVPGITYNLDGSFEPALASDGEEIWVNLSETMTGGSLGIQRWGYTVGMMSGRKPIVVPADNRPTWELTKAAHRSDYQGLVIGALAILLVVFLLGVRRIPDLWAKVPEERVDYWPGRAIDAQTGAGPDGAPEGGGGEGGEGS